MYKTKVICLPRITIPLRDFLRAEYDEYYENYYLYYIGRFGPTYMVLDETEYKLLQKQLK